MLEKDDGLVLKVKRSGETSLLVTFLSRRMGKIRLMAKSALTSRSPVRGLLETGNHIEVVFYYKENRNVYYLREAAPLMTLFPNRDSLPHLALRLAAMELLDAVCYPGSADEAIVDLAVEYGGAGETDDFLFLFLAFELKLLAVLGVFPDLSECSSCGGDLDGGVYSAESGTSYCGAHASAKTGGHDTLELSSDTVDIARRCAAEPLAVIAGERVDPQTRKHLGKIVHWTYTFHVQGYNLPKSLSLI